MEEKLDLETLRNYIENEKEFGTDEFNVDNIDFNGVIKLWDDFPGNPTIQKIISTIEERRIEEMKAMTEDMVVYLLEEEEEINEMNEDFKKISNDFNDILRKIAKEKEEEERRRKEEEEEKKRKEEEEKKKRKEEEKKK